MQELGFDRLKSDARIFYYKHKCTGMVVTIVYVDDALFCGQDLRIINLIKGKFMQKWECRDLGDVKEFLRMHIQRTGQTIKIDQCTYLDKVLHRFEMQNAKSAQTPLPAGYNPKANEGPVDANLRSKYQMAIGSLLYIMIGTRPDIAFAVTLLSSHSANPSQDHYDRTLYIMRYLIGTKNYSLKYDGRGDLGLTACTDADWAGNPNTRRSVTGYFLKIAGGIFSWQSRAQKTVALSATEAEYMSLSDCSRQVVWVQSLCKELGYNLTPTPICGDNQGSIFMASHPMQNPRSKHIDIRYHYIREVVASGKVALFFIEGSENPADLFTKNLGHVKFEKFRDSLGLEFYSS